jgi:hypothetical protein
MVQIVTAQQIKDYVLGQPDDKPVNNENNYSNSNCGCVMIQYGKEKLGLNDFSCGFSVWEILDDDEYNPIFELEDGLIISDIFKISSWTNFTNIKTFGELKKHCKYEPEWTPRSYDEDGEITE